MTTRDRILSYIATNHCYVNDVYEKFKKEVSEEQMKVILDGFTREGKVTIRNAKIEVI